MVVGLQTPSEAGSGPGWYGLWEAQGCSKAGSRGPAEPLPELSCLPEAVWLKWTTQGAHDLAPSMRCRLSRGPYLENEAVSLVLGVHGRQPVLALRGDVYLVACECVAHFAELLDLGLEHLLEPLVF